MRVWKKTVWRDQVAYTPMGERLAMFPDLPQPYVFPWFYPNGARSHVNIRMDTDYSTPREWMEAMEILEPLGKHASWFVTTNEMDEKMLDELEKTGVEIGSHMHWHFTHKDYQNLKWNMSCADWKLRQEGIQCRSFVSPSAKWSPALSRCVQEMGYEYSSEFGLAYDSLPFMAEGSLQIPVHPISFGNFKTEEDISGYFVEAAKALHASCLPVHLYGHPHDVHKLGRKGVEEILALPDISVSTLLEYALWWKNRTFEYSIKRFPDNPVMEVTWHGSEGVQAAVTWDGVHVTLLSKSHSVFYDRECASGKEIILAPYRYDPVPIHKQLNWRSRVGQWLDTEYVLPLCEYSVSGPKTAINYLLKRYHD